MILIWIVVFILIANAFFTDLLVNWPLQIFQWFSMGLNFVLIAAAIALGSWLIGDD